MARKALQRAGAAADALLTRVAPRSDAAVLHADIHHPPWPLRPAAGEFERNTMTAPFGIELSGEPLLHVSARQDVLIWPPAITGVR